MSDHIPHCTYTRWQIIDRQDNKDYKCDITDKLCYGELKCKYYKPDVSEYQKAFEDIRTEINEEMKRIIRDEYSQRQNDYCDGCEWECKHILEIIDKHDPSKAGKENNG